MALQPPEKEAGYVWDDGDFRADYYLGHRADYLRRGEASSDRRRGRQGVERFQEGGSRHPAARGSPG